MDNQSALSVAQNPEHHGRMKHLDLRFYWLRDVVEAGHVKVCYVSTQSMPADILTKALGYVKVQHMIGLLRLSWLKMCWIRGECWNYNPNPFSFHYSDICTLVHFTVYCAFYCF